MSAFLAAIPLIGKVIDKLFPDPAQRDQAKLRLLELQQQGDLAELDAEVKLALGQLEVNKAEAQSAHWFIAGWRPAVGWICAAGVGWNFIVQPLVLWWGAFHEPAIQAPALESDQLMVLLLGMLGIGGMRSFDKMQGTDAKGFGKAAGTAEAKGG
jgi:hypothetical protein